MSTRKNKHYDVVACDLSICTSCKMCCPILKLYMHNFRPEPDSNLEPHPNLTLIPTLAKSYGTFCKLRRLTRCVQPRYCTNTKDTTIYTSQIKLTNGFVADLDTTGHTTWSTVHYSRSRMLAARLSLSQLLIILTTYTQILSVCATFGKWYSTYCNLEYVSLTVLEFKLNNNLFRCQCKNFYSRQSRIHQFEHNFLEKTKTRPPFFHSWVDNPSHTHPPGYTAELWHSCGVPIQVTWLVVTEVEAQAGDARAAHFCKFF